jgi:hypothetical protein
MTTTTNIQSFDLGFIGHKASTFQNLFSEYTIKENEYGYFLEFVNYSELENNKGVYALTNCFENEEHFKERLMIKFLERI